MHRGGRVIALLGIVVGVIGLAIDFWIVVGAGAGPKGRGVAYAVVDYWTYLTHLSNFGLVLVYLSELTGWRWLRWFRAPIGRASMAGIIALVLVYFHFFLAPYYTSEGGLLISNYTLHYVAPILYLLWWALFTGHGTLRFGQVPWMLVPGFIYLAWVFVRGSLVHAYPYDILDVGKHGYFGIVPGVLLIIIAVTLFCLVLVLADRWLGKRRIA